MFLSPSQKLSHARCENKKSTFMWMLITLCRHVLFSSRIYLMSGVVMCLTNTRKIGFISKRGTARKSVLPPVWGNAPIFFCCNQVLLSASTVSAIICVNCQKCILQWFIANKSSRVAPWTAIGGAQCNSSSPVQWRLWDESKFPARQ